MIQSLDLIVIGTGASGSSPAAKCREAGWRVAVVDDQPYGGTCALRGCDPKKVLVGAAELVEWHRRMVGAGVDGEARIDWQELMRFKRSFTEPVPSNRQATFEQAGIATYHGRARFVADNRLAIGDDLIESKYFVIATGARPASLGLPGEEHVRTSTEFLDLDDLPGRVAFIGAGYISFELAHVARLAGARVSVLGNEPPLRQFDQGLVAELAERTRSMGIDLRSDSQVTRVEKRGDAFVVHVKSPAGHQVIETDLVVHGAGRVPDTDGLGTREAGIATDARGAVLVNEHMQSVSNARVYAAGDVALPSGSMPLTPVARLEGDVVASNLLQGNSRVPDYRAIPSVVFASPPLAMVGLTEAEAKRQGLAIRVKAGETGSWYSNRRVRETVGMYKTIVEEGSDRLLGAHLLGRGADEVINVFALAIRHGVTAGELKHGVYAYPTRGSDVPYMV